jgi:hypothetical protein
MMILAFAYQLNIRRAHARPAIEKKPGDEIITILIARLI